MKNIINLPREQPPLSGIILFDGACNLCAEVVKQFILTDKKGVLKYASLQSDYGQRFLKENKLNPVDFDSFIYIQNGKHYTKSNAFIQVMTDIYRFGKLLKCLLIIPTSIRDFMYDIIAKNRYKWFGKKESCLLPKPEWKERFIE